MSDLGDELRLLIFVLVQSLMLFTCWRFAARCAAAGVVQRLIDTLLLTYVVQYVAVGLPGLAGCLSPISMQIVAVVISLALLAIGWRSSQLAKPQGSNPHDRIILTLGGLFIAGYVGAFVWQQRYLPPMATDALTYQFPAAVQWLQHGRIDLFQTWFFNPANTYSPLAGSMFYAWLLGPIGNDAIAHVGPAPMVGLLLLASIATSRAMGGRVLPAVLAALALCLCRPIVNQIDKCKDDLFLAAFFAVAVAGLAQSRLRDPFGPFRLGLAIGLCLATKYTAILALPMLVLAVDAPWRAGWTWPRWLAMIGSATVIAGPWYLRNLVAFHNPLYPADFLGFHGLFSTARSLELRTPRGVLGVLLNNSFAITGLFGSLMLVTWLITWTRLGAKAWRDPLVRLCLIGPIIGVALFIGVSPYPEVRFIVSAIFLMIAAVGSASGRMSWIEPTLLLVAAVVTGIDGPWDLQTTFVISGVVTALLGLGLVAATGRWKIGRDKLVLAGLLVVLVMAGFAFVDWTSFLNARADLAMEAWGIDSHNALWRFVRTQILPREPLAYTGTFTIYPLMGFNLDRPVVYAPVRAGVKIISDLPRLGDNLPGERITPAAVAVTISHADVDVWLQNLAETGAKHLAVCFENDQPRPIEATWATQHPDRFQLEYQDRSGQVYRIRE